MFSCIDPRFASIQLNLSRVLANGRRTGLCAPIVDRRFIPIFLVNAPIHSRRTRGPLMSWLIKYLFVLRENNQLYASRCATVLKTFCNICRKYRKIHNSVIKLKFNIFILYKYIYKIISNVYNLSFTVRRKILQKSANSSRYVISLYSMSWFPLFTQNLNRRSIRGTAPRTPAALFTITDLIQRWRGNIMSLTRVQYKDKGRKPNGRGGERAEGGQHIIP